MPTSGHGLLCDTLYMKSSHRGSKDISLERDAILQAEGMPPLTLHEKD